MRKYYNPEMNIASFDKEAVATTASQALNNWQANETTVERYQAEVDFQKMTAVNVEF